MLVTKLKVRDFRSHELAELDVGPAITVLHGDNGSGKTNLLEAVFIACTGRSFRTSADRELVRFGAQLARLELYGEAPDGAHEIAVGISPGEARRFHVDRSPVARLLDVEIRPLVTVFSPDRLELVKGTPALRRAHIDQVVCALWPARMASRRSLGQALAQRNALLIRIRAGQASSESLGAWDTEVGRHGIAVMDDRRSAVALLAPRFGEIADSLGLDGGPELVYRPRSLATTAQELTAEITARRATDLERGFSSHGPHRDDLRLAREGRELRSYGSQGQQRLGLLALLLAEREAIADSRGRAPLLLLDDVTSELDPERRQRLIDLLGAQGAKGAQSIITTTDLGQLPSRGQMELIAVPSGVSQTTSLAA
ncbi:MAG: DNA replication and repair protein RecF [Actinomycetota bacterium]